MKEYTPVLRSGTPSIRLIKIQNILSLSILLILLAVPSANAQEAWAQEAAMINSGPADTGSVQVKVMQLQEEMRQLRGKIEELQFQNSKLTERLDKVSQDYEFRLGELEKHQAGVATPAQTELDEAISEEKPAKKEKSPKAEKSERAEKPEKSVKTSEEDMPLSMRDGGDGSQKILGTLRMGDEKFPSMPSSSRPAMDNIDRPVVEKLFIEKPTPPKTGKLTTREQYDAAFNLLKERKFPEAISALEDFANKNRKDPLAANAIYWAGEAYYVQENYTEAAKKFVDSYKKSPKGQKAPDALLKLSMALAQLNQKKEACTTLAELNDKFPKVSSSLKKKAAAEKKKYGCK